MTQEKFAKLKIKHTKFFLCIIVTQAVVTKQSTEYKHQDKWPYSIKDWPTPKCVLNWERYLSGSKCFGFSPLLYSALYLFRKAIDAYGSSA